MRYLYLSMYNKAFVCLDDIQLDRRIPGPGERTNRKRFKDFVMGRVVTTEMGRFL